MKLIVFTSPQFLPNEGLLINKLFACGIDRLHLRKLGSSVADCERLIQSIAEEWRASIVLHDHFELCPKWHLGGVHLNSRNPNPPQEHVGTVSRSCHSTREVEQWKKECNYLTLSPIFNSISKQGYMGAFSDEQLLEARQHGIISNKVVALGGVTLNNIPKARCMGFGGVALLGDVWGRIEGGDDAWQYVRALRRATDE